jgi:hypothetical protein
MPLTEHQAQQITLVRVLEQTQNNGSVWSASDAKEATRAARDLAGDKASFAEFVARRAQWVLEEISRRTPEQALPLRPARWPMLGAQLLAVFALISGVLTDVLAGFFLAPKTVHVVVLPLLFLFVWNVVFFVVFLVQWVLRFFRRTKHSTGPVVELLGRWRISESMGFRRTQRSAWAESFEHDWAQLAGPVNEARLKVAVNLASIFFTAGALGSLLVKSIVLRYTVGWETSHESFTAQFFYSIIAVIFKPADLVGMQVPDAQHIASLEMPPSSGEVAGNWFVLYLVSMLAWVVIPRLYLVALNAFARWRMCRNFPLPMNATYFTTLRAAWRGQRIGVSVVPFRYELSPALRSHLSTMLERIYGLAVDITVEPAVLMGDDATDWKKTVNREGHVAVMVIFNLAATAEADAHGALLQALRKAIDNGTPVIPIVDTGAYHQDDPERFRQRCNQWRQTLDTLKFIPLFLDLHKAAADDLKLLNDRLNHDD